MIILASLYINTGTIAPVQSKKEYKKTTSLISRPQHKLSLSYLTMLRRRRSRRREQERSADNNNSSISSNSGDNHEGIAASHPRLDEDESLVGSEAVECDTTTLISDSSIPLRDSSTDNSVSAAAAAAAAAAAVSANNGRREKHRFFRAQRARSVATTTTTTPTSSSSRTPRSASSSSTPPRFELELDVGHGPPRRLHSQQDTISVDEEASDDTIGSLPNEPSSTFLMNDRISTLTENSNQQHPSTTSTSSPNAIAPDYIPPPVVPGAVYTRGRAFGEIPQWMRQQCNNSNTTASSRSSELLGPVQRRRRPRETTRDGPPPPTIPQETGRRHPQIATRTPPGSPVGTSTGVPRGQQSSSLGEQRPGVGPRSTSLLSGRAGNLTSNSSHLPRGRLGRSPRSFLRRSVSSPSQRTNFSHSLTGSVRNLFTSLRSSSYSALLPEAEALDSEKVVYAEVIVDEEGHDQQHDSDEDDSVVCSWELLLYSVILLSVGFWIGRITAAAPLVPSSSSTAAL